MVVLHFPRRLRPPRVDLHCACASGVGVGLLSLRAAVGAQDGVGVAAVVAGELEQEVKKHNINKQLWPLHHDLNKCSLFSLLQAILAYITHTPVIYFCDCAEVCSLDAAAVVAAAAAARGSCCLRCCTRSSSHCLTLGSEIARCRRCWSLCWTCMKDAKIVLFSDNLAEKTVTHTLFSSGTSCQGRSR